MFTLAPFAQRIARTRRLYLDHIGAHIAQQLPAKRPRDQLAQLDYPDPVKRAGHYGTGAGKGGACAAMPGSWRPITPASQWLAAIIAVRSNPVSIPARPSI